MARTYIPEEGITSQLEFLKWVARESFPTVKSHRSTEYYNIPAAFDIETTSFYENDIRLPENKRAILYHWQFGIWNKVTVGRTWDELKTFLSHLSAIMGISDELRLAIYIHNLPYEFQWMRKRFEWDKVFILDEHKPVYARSSGLEFRCMLKLAGGRSLDAVSKDLQKYKVEKMVGDLDYDVMRTPLTPLTPKELKYCENDIRVCLAYIMEKIEQDGDITKIPLTNTGYVRNYCRKQCYKRWKPYRSLMNELTVTTEEYLQLKDAFQGGFTHANAHHVQKVLSTVGSYDLTSAYPSVMVLEQFPMSKAVLIDHKMNRDELEHYLHNYCCMFDIKLTGVYPKLHQEHPISSSKCSELEGYVLDNGRVVFADSLVTTITEQDYFIYKEFYGWDTEEIFNFNIYRKGLLPKQFTDAVLDLFGKKTQLKGIAGQELEYMISKNMLNAAYGMSVTDPVRTSYDYIDDLYKKTTANVEEAIERYNKDIKRFLYYPWGVWVTAYCRANLFSAIIACGNDYVYADTDSVKLLNPDKHREYFSLYNKGILDKIEFAAEYRNQNPNLYMPISPKGKVCVIGSWDDEGVYDEFKTLGAKRYLTRKGEKYSLTVAGTNKVKSCKYLVETGNPFGNFDTGLVIPNDRSGRNILRYIDDATSGVLVDCNGVPYEYEELSSIHMESSIYSLSMSDSFIKYLKGVRDISE